jgi:uncharacterized protein YciI
MPELFAVTRTRGPNWDHARRMEEQTDWQAHAMFMDGLHDEGFMLLVGPLEDTPDVLLIVRADSVEEVGARLAADPWIANGLLRQKQIARWTLRLGTLDRHAPASRVTPAIESVSFANPAVPHVVDVAEARSAISVALAFGRRHSQAFDR